jgi:hypothetical protein
MTNKFSGKIIEPTTDKGNDTFSMAKKIYENTPRFKIENFHQNKIYDSMDLAAVYLYHRQQVHSLRESDKRDQQWKASLAHCDP